MPRLTLIEQLQKAISEKNYDKAEQINEQIQAKKKSGKKIQTKKPKKPQTKPKVVKYSSESETTNNNDNNSDDGLFRMTPKILQNYQADQSVLPHFNTFVDEVSNGEKKEPRKAPVQKQQRPKAKKLKLVCERCRKNFEIWNTELQIRKGAGSGTNQATICDYCLGTGR